MVHELVHVRQIRRQEHSIKAGYATITGLSEAGFIAGSALTYLDSHSFALAAGVGIYAAVGGIGLGYSIAPHEREARRIARQAEYMGIITMACSLE
jgi:hypothetical protein